MVCCLQLLMTHNANHILHVKSTLKISLTYSVKLCFPLSLFSTVITLFFIVIQIQTQDSSSKMNNEKENLLKDIVTFLPFSKRLNMSSLIANKIKTNM